MTTKIKQSWVCSECGQVEARWVGQCPGCKNWSTLSSQTSRPLSSSRELFHSKTALLLDEVPTNTTVRIQSGSVELDRLLGGGIVPGAVMLIGGAPGIGKSTLLMQLCANLCKTGKKVLYVCGEESAEQCKLRANRLGVANAHFYLLAECELESIGDQVEKIQPDVLVIDSIQVLYRKEKSSACGTVSQLRECTSELIRSAKSMSMATFLVGHVTKSGELAGPKLLEHMVDTVLEFEGDRKQQLRILRAMKNRFGPTDDVAVYEMQESGLSELPNYSEKLLEERAQMSGSVIVPALEGSRPMLLEIQALVSNTPYPAPTRRAVGVNQKRLALLIAVLEKRGNLQLNQRDIFVSCTGGMNIKEPAADLALAMAISSSYANRPLRNGLVVLGEVGLGGELRSVTHLTRRMNEAQKLGFSHMLLPQCQCSSAPKTSLELIPVAHIQEALRVAFQ